MPRSPIHHVHELQGARFTEFGGWTMPLQYTGVLAEHAAVREAVGIFDVSHLGRFEVSGAGAKDVLQSQLCNDVARIGPGRAQYTMALNDRGGIEDDIIIWYIDDERFWVMPNGTNSNDIQSRFRAASPDSVEVFDIRRDTALFAVQGIAAPELIESAVGAVPGRFRVAAGSLGSHTFLAAGTGYTGEAGGEFCVPMSSAAAVWHEFVLAGATPCGLGARDTLRLEQGYPLWGQDIDETTTPLEAGLGWVVAWDHEFVGRSALEAQRESLPRQLVAFTTEGRTIPRAGHNLTSESGSGTVTSGNFSPTLQHGIGLAYMTPAPRPDEKLTVSIRGTDVPATVVKLPFVKG